MTDLKYNILGFLYHSDNRETQEIAVYNQRFDNVDDVGIAIDDMLKSVPPLIVKPVGKNTLKLTSHGNVAYELEKEIRYNDACKKRQQRFDNKVSIASILVPTITFFIGLIVEHCTQVIDLVISLFK